jgi:hypothetical protein
MNIFQNIGKRIQVAKKLRDQRGWGQWEAYNNGAYKDFLDYYDNL